MALQSKEAQIHEGLFTLLGHLCVFYMNSSEIFHVINLWMIFQAPMNMIDFLAIVPFYLSLLLEGLEDFEIIGKAGKIIRLVKVDITSPMY